MIRFNAVLFALLMATMSLAGCFGGHDSDDSDEEPVETLDDWMVYSVKYSNQLIIGLSLLNNLTRLLHEISTICNGVGCNLIGS